MKAKEIEAINKLNNVISNLKGNLGRELNNNVQILVQGLNNLDQEVKQKEQLLVQKEIEKEHAVRSKSVEKNNLLVQKDKEVKELEKVKNGALTKELIEILPQAYPSAKGSDYNKPFEKWHPTSWGKKVIDAGNFEEIKSNLPWLRKKGEENDLKKELIEIAHRLYPESYSTNFRDWKVDSDLKKTIEKNDFKEIDKLLPLYRGRLAEKQAKELEDVKRLKEETIKKDQLLGLLATNPPNFRQSVC